MKKILLFFALIVSSICSSQFNFEHIYFTGHISRIVLENSGEKYFLVDYSNHKIDFYNANHTFWKTILLPIAENNYSMGVSHISENKLNNDNLIEIIYNTYSAPNLRQSKIINENGTLLLTVDNCYSLSLDKQDGIAYKIISNAVIDTKIFSVPELLLEHTYTESNLRRIKLENSGEKYYTVNNTTGIVTIYNDDHTFWKSVTLTIPEDYGFSALSFLSENQINDDNLLELGYSYSLNGENITGQTKIINENGTLLATFDNTRFIKISNINGFSSKLIAGTYNNLTLIYSCPSLILEHTYAGNVERVILENSGEKYYDAKRSNFEVNTSGLQQTIIYNADHTPWKTIPLIAPQVEWSIYDIYLSETKFNADNLLEIAYSCSANTLDGGHYESNIINELGTVLLNESDASSLYISELSNLQNKLIVLLTPNLFSGFAGASSVYGLPSSTAGIENFNLKKVTISPNPATTFLNINSENSIIKVAVVYDLQGRTVHKFEGKNLEILDVQKISTGSYILMLTDNNNNSSAFKFIINAK